MAGQNITHADFQPALSSCRASLVCSKVHFLQVVAFCVSGLHHHHGPAVVTQSVGLAYLTGLAHIAAKVAIVVGILPRPAVTLEAIMMSLLGLLVWVPNFFTRPRPVWATSLRNQ